jgi:hypothetical protein
MPNTTCCARRELTRDGEEGGFYCANRGQTADVPRVSAVARWAGALAADELREAAFIGSTAREDSDG